MQREGSQPCSFHLRVLGLGFAQDGDVEIGVFPKGEEILVGTTHRCLRSRGASLETSSASGNQTDPSMKGAAAVPYAPPANVQDSEAEEG